MAGVPNGTLTGNVRCDFPNTDSVLPRQLPLTMNFPGKKFPLFTPSKVDFTL